MLSADLLYHLFTILADDTADAVRLSHVCPTWRYIVLNAPLLWTNVSLPVLDCTMAQTLLARSQDQLFQLTIHLGTVRGLEMVLAPHSRRLRKLRFVATSLRSLEASKHLSMLPTPALEERESVMENAPGMLSMVEQRSDLPCPLDAAPSFALTSLSFWYLPSLSLPGILDIVATHQRTLKNLKLYFPTPFTALDPPQWDLMYGARIDLALLECLHIGYNDAHTLAPFMKRLRLPSLQTLSIQDFGMCPEPNTPERSVYAGFSLLYSNPLQELISAVLDAIPAPSFLKSLALTGLYIPPEEPEDILEQLFAICGPSLLDLELVECDTVFLEALAETLVQNDQRWQLETVSARGMCLQGLVECLGIRKAYDYPRLKQLTLAPYKKPPSEDEMLEQFAGVIIWKA